MFYLDFQVDSIPINMTRITSYEEFFSMIDKESVDPREVIVRKYHHQVPKLCFFPTYITNDCRFFVTAASTYSSTSSNHLAQLISILNIIYITVSARFGDDIHERAAGRAPKPANCKPYETIVTLELPDPEENANPLIVKFPKCTTVQRCGGCDCGALLSCQPSDAQQIAFEVIFVFPCLLYFVKLRKTIVHLLLSAGSQRYLHRRLEIQLQRQRNRIGWTA